MKKNTYFVSGMHCASCEVLLEKKLRRLPQVTKVEASSSREQVTLYSQGQAPTLSQINRLLNPDGYSVYLTSQKKTTGDPGFLSRFAFPFLIASGLFLLFLGLNRLGLAGLVNVTTTSSLPTFILFGLLAGVSTCAALVGGVVLSMSAHWKNSSPSGVSLFERMRPHLLFNFGRLVSFVFLGFILGAVGSRLSFSLTINALLVVAVSIFMAANGLKMLGVKALKNYRLALPKFLTRLVSDRADLQSRSMPTVLGALTIFLPCGFTLTAESLALVSGDPVMGALIMAAFALGTVPGLLAIGFSAVKIGENSRRIVFSRVAGALILLFAAFNINSQFNVLGLPSLNKVNAPEFTPVNRVDKQTEALPEITAGKQVIKMQANASGYSPAYFKIRAGVPVRWEITDIGTSGCTNAVISKSLFEGQIDLVPGTTSIKEFTVADPGRYKFSCWMGMVTGVIDAVGESGDSVPAVSSLPENSYETHGCGCGHGR